jgi:GntR family transcriptional regulator
LTVDRDNPLPLHVQLKQALSDSIRRGVWKPGQRLPGEPELCRAFGVSRTTVRQALNELARQGLVVREQGRGTYVAQPKLVGTAAQRLSGFHEDMTALGRPMVSQVLRQQVSAADELVAEHLDLRPGDPVVEIERLRLVEGQPVVLTTTYLPQAQCPGLETADLRRRSLYEFLHTECRRTLARGWRTIEAVAADSRQARLLAARKGAPLILIQSVSYLSNGRPIEYYHAVHRGDRSRFEVELVRGQPMRSGRRHAGRLPSASGQLIGLG